MVNLNFKKEATIKWLLLIPSLILLITFLVSPFVWTFLTSLKERAEIFAYPLSYFPKSPTLANYIEVLTDPQMPFSRFLINSIIVSSSTTFLTMIISALAGYSLARFRFVGKSSFTLIFLTTQMFPSALLIAPLLGQWARLGLLNTYQVLILSNFSFTVPFTVWMLMGYFGTIPVEIEESAMLDGCTRFQALIRVILPLAAPGIAATAAYAFISCWSELVFAMTFVTSTEHMTLSAGMMHMIGEYEVHWELLTAGAIIGLTPVIILFSFLQKYLVRGLTAGAVKF
ncbi:MAG: carbohydrate ABC transporter permease [Candidatus Hodarchaeota archaeon]